MVGLFEGFPVMFWARALGWFRMEFTSLLEMKGFGYWLSFAAVRRRKKEKTEGGADVPSKNPWPNPTWKRIEIILFIWFPILL